MHDAEVISRDAIRARMGRGVAAGEPLRVLLFSVLGAGERYSGPGTSAYRLYRRANPDRLRVWMLHGAAAQEALPEFTGCSLARVYDRSTLGQGRFLVAAKRWLREHVDCFDVFHGLQGFTMTIGCALAAEARGVPAAVKLAAHRADFSDKRGTLRGLLGLQRRRRAAAKRVSAMIAISTAIREELLGYGFDPRRIVHIPNGVDTERFRPVESREARSRARAELGWPDEPTILFVGQIGARKRPLLLVEALGELHRRGVAARVVLLGPTVEPEYEAMMRDAAERLGVTDRILWLGHRTDPVPFMRPADCFVLPSSSEGMPNALLEAMACALPAIGTRISGIEDLIDDGRTGRLVEPSSGALVEAISDCITHPDRAAEQGAAGREVIEERYSVLAVLAAHEALFRRLMRGEAANPEG